ncbi:MAG TPA: hypothetical protein VGB61_14900 [Pyrinomonadaceae bacterium]|jgi:hypothetical protein
MSDPNPPAPDGDPPIIITGGGSINVVIPATFTEQAHSEKQKDFKNDNVNLISVQIDDNPPITLNKNSKITITYK